MLRTWTEAATAAEDREPEDRGQPYSPLRKNGITLTISTENNYNECRKMTDDSRKDW